MERGRRNRVAYGDYSFADLSNFVPQKRRLLIRGYVSCKNYEERMILESPVMTRCENFTRVSKMR